MFPPPVKLEKAILLEAKVVKPWNSRPSCAMVMARMSNPGEKN